jgi:hypothetical protein
VNIAAPVILGDGSAGSVVEQLVASTRPHFKSKQGTGYLRTESYITLNS